MPSTPRSIISSKNARTLIGIGAVEQRGVGGNTESAAEGFAHAVEGDVVSAFAADGEVVLLALAVHVDGEGQILAAA